MKKNYTIINFKVDIEDAEYLSAKAKRLGMSRSRMIKVLALNGEITFSMAEKLRKPKL
jgi:hypothetical protein